LKRFLIIQTAFIGDVILATSLLEKLHKFYPDAELDFLLRKGNETLFNAHPYIKNIVIWDKKKNKIANLLKLIKTIRKAKYSHVINLQRFASSGLLTVFSRAPEKTGFDKNPFSFLFTRKIKHTLLTHTDNPHEIIRNLSLIKEITDDTVIKPCLYPSQQDYDNVKHLKKQKYICIAPASVWFTKQFPSDKWAEFLKQVHQPLCVYFIGSKTDYDFVEEIIAKSGYLNIKFQNLCGKLTLLESAALMQNAEMNFVNDSAPLHICSAVNAPTTAVFCSTTERFGFGPLADKSFVIESSVALKCRPCNNHGKSYCPEKHFKCANTIDIKKMLKTIQ